MKKEVMLEPSTNTHKMEADSITADELSETDMVLKIKGNGVVFHGEHGTIATESEDVIKTIQQEYNPVTKKIQAAFD